MAVKHFAVRLDSTSTESGDIDFKALVVAGASADFDLTNCTGTLVNELNLITKKGGTYKDHKFTATLSGSTATASISASQLSAVYDDANGGNCDFIEAKWTVGSIDTPSKSEQYIRQLGSTYNLSKWPPNTPCN